MGFQLHIDVGARSDVGRVRQENEDAFRLEPSCNLYLVCDGLGGHASGATASAMAVETIARVCLGARGSLAESELATEDPGPSPRTNRLVGAVIRANREIFEAGEDNAELRGMGATVVAAWIDGRRLSLVHVGDSRAYLLRSARLEQLTADHTVVAEQVRLGILAPGEVATSALQNVLMRALGPVEHVEVDASEHDLQEGDTLLLCSDGLTHMASDAEVAQVLLGQESAQEQAARLVDLANEKGGADNVTAIVVRVLGEEDGLGSAPQKRRGL